MSETARTYKGMPRRRKPALHRRSGPRMLRRIVLVLVLIGIIAIFWTVRDSHDLKEFMPSDTRLRVFLPEFLDRRIKVANAQIWKALPQDSPLPDIPRNILGDADMPEWVLRNLVGPESYILGNDTVEFTDALLLTKMSPVGTLVERFNRFSFGVKRDDARGLKIYALTDAELYYATRGRVLLVSGSRRALIYALTLDEGERGDFLNASHENDMTGTIALSPKDPGGQWFDSVDFAFRIDATDVRLDFQAHLKPERRAELEARSLGRVPERLAIPMEGPISLSADFGIPLKELSAILADLFDWPALSADQWAKWERDKEESPNAASLATLLGPLGPQLRLTWLGFDTNEMFPVPKFTAQLGGDQETVVRALQALPKPPTGPAYGETYAYYDSRTDLMYAPLASGPSLQPCATWHGQNLLFSTSSEVLGYLLTSPKEDRFFSEPVNLYVSVSPTACVEALTQAGTLLAQNDLLKNHTPESFYEQTTTWKSNARFIQQITGLFTLVDGILNGRVHVLSPAP